MVCQSADKCEMSQKFYLMPMWHISFDEGQPLLGIFSTENLWLFLGKFCDGHPVIF